MPSYDVESFVNSIEKPRRIMLMVQAGPGTDATIQALLPHLDKGDILIDGGNTSTKIPFAAMKSWLTLASTSSVQVFPVVKRAPWKGRLSCRVVKRSI